MPTSPQSMRTEVLVMGAGAAGMAAAIGAARSGLQVLILEKNAYPGGNATAAYVGTICGLYFRNTLGPAQFVMGGFPKEFALKVQKKSKSRPFKFGEGLHFLPYDREAFMAVVDTLLRDHQVDVFYDTTITGIEQMEVNKWVVHTRQANRALTIESKALIDATGSAISGQLGVSSLVNPSEYQAAAQVFGMGGIPIKEERILHLSIIRTIQRGLKDGSFPLKYQRLSVIPGSLKEGQLFFKIGIPLKVDNTIENRKEIEAFARTAIDFIVEYLKGNCDSFAKSFLTFLAPEVGFRTGPRHLGKENLTREDVLQARKRKDGIARGAWPVEFWKPGENPRMEYFPENDFYEITPGMLQSTKSDNLFFAGRHISAEEDAIASARVIGTCLATGYAAGKLAAGQLTATSIKQSILAIRQDLEIK